MNDTYFLLLALFLLCIHIYMEQKKKKKKRKKGGVVEAQGKNACNIAREREPA